MHQFALVIIDLRAKDTRATAWPMPPISKSPKRRSTRTCTKQFISEQHCHTPLCIYTMLSDARSATARIRYIIISLILSATTLGVLDITTSFHAHSRCRYGLCTHLNLLAVSVARPLGPKLRIQACHLQGGGQFFWGHFHVILTQDRIKKPANACLTLSGNHRLTIMHSFLDDISSLISCKYFHTYKFHVKVIQAKNSVSPFTGQS
ncbi:MAG: hypothetical protein ACI9O0_000422 [Paracoccaceae bacterium]|jgi:hypothetical protein